MADTNKYDRYVWLFLAAITIIRMIMALFLGLAPQESYYWNYSQHPDLSYFDHPPMAAYLILVFTTILGDNTFGIHFAAIFVSLILSLVLYYFNKAMFNARIAFWTVIVGATTFIFALGGLVITPDGPLLLFWVLTMFSLYLAEKRNDLRWWLLTGVFLGCAMFSKYTAAFTGLGALLYLVTSKERLKSLLKPGPYIAVISAFIVFLPVVVWNYRHGWASFGFQGGDRAAEFTVLRPDLFFGFLGSQVGVLAVFLFPLFIWALYKAIRLLRHDSRIALFFWFSVPTVVVFSFVGLFHFVKMNWLAPAYISALPLAVFLYFERLDKSGISESNIPIIRPYASSLIKALLNFFRSDLPFLIRYTRFAVIFSIVAIIVVHVLIFLPNFTFGRGDTVAGWPELAKRVDQIKDEMQNEGELFICGYEYKTASQLRFYLDGQPETVSNNVVGKMGLQYDYWCDPDTLVGKNCIFVYDQRRKYKDGLTQFFERVSEPEQITIKKGGNKVTDFYIYRCYNYRGIQ